ncbi:MAG: FliC/FljB family flagellin [Burkholderiaceae bacterium]
MMSVINTNYLSLVAQNNLQKSQSALGNAIERLSSGLRINSAKDDAAGQAIANRMSAQTRGLAQAQRNANDGISVAQTAEGALNEVNTNLQRIRELAVQSLNDTYTTADRDSLQAEINQRLAEIDRISAQTDFNGVKVLANDTTLNIQVGANDGEVIEIDLEAITSNSLDLSTFNVNGAKGTPVAASTAAFEAAWGETTEIADSSVTAAGTAEFKTDLGITTGTVTIDTANALVDDAGNWFAQVTVAALTSTEQAETGLENRVYYVALNPNDAATATTTAAFTLDMSDLTARALKTGATDNPLAALDTALTTVDTLRSDLGAIQNRLETAITNLQTNSTNLTAARSRIEDADYAVEVANMTRSQILQQAGTSVLAQANQLPQGVLSLLR